MRYFSLPGIETQISAICLGTGSYGSAYSLEDSFALLDTFAELGGNFVDTAHVYADWLPNGAGASERTVGKWLQSRGVQDQFIVGTKGGHPKLGTMAISRLRPDDIAQDLTESLERLQLPSVGLYWLHRDDPAIPVGEILSALNEHLSAGQIQAIGASNWSTQRLQEAAEYAAAHHLVGFCASQIAWSLAQANEPYNAAMRTISMDASALEYYCRAALKVIPYSSQANGFFTSSSDPASDKFGGYRSALNFQRRERALELAERKGASSNAVALAYLLHHPCGGTAIVGCRTPEQVRDSCTASDIALTAEDLRFLEALS